MGDKPILFSGPVVRALLDGRKTQTRRILKPQPEHKQIHDFRGRRLWECDHRMWCWKHLVLDNIWDFPDGEDRKTLAAAQRYAVGDRLWVRESFAIVPRTAYRMSEGVQQTLRPENDHDAAIYREGWDRSKPGPWRPSIHMPRWASRLTLTVTDVRVQRLQDISEADAVAEGVSGSAGGWWTAAEGQAGTTPRAAFGLLWNSINGPDAWDQNPWVAAYTFTVDHRNIDTGEA
ncbi:hypothetical protein [Thalassobaculum sp.]|uniref:hypothetical protein n=1 Tax=Thalassobaculum sp. TaxID=2022740 RepID=UPI0032F08C1F